MLYITTRTPGETYTAQKALRDNRGADGGLYLPLRAPRFSAQELEALLDMPVNQTIASILNLLFPVGMTGWEVDFSVGRRPIQVRRLSRRVWVGELWHNPEGSFDRLTRDLVSGLLGDLTARPGNWAKIAVRVASLFGIFSQLRREGVAGPVDIAVVAGDFSGPVSAWYARQWGLPIGSIICCCNENNGLWELFHLGQFRTDAVAVSTSVPQADVTLPVDLERLIFAQGGIDQVNGYLEACRRGALYCPEESLLESLRQGVTVSVVSTPRMESILLNVHKTRGYLLSPGAALAYGGLMDYMAKGGSGRNCLILSEDSPAASAGIVSHILGIDPGDVSPRIKT